jgi:cellulose synthase/poly-beta-1,6-N-acetylglucosamine synthase-like glycosyltransferase
LNYPKEKLNIIWITDGSDDGSDVYLKEKYKNYNSPKVEVYHQPERKGKSAAINRVMNFVRTEIVIFCDANTFLNKDSILNIVKHFQNSKVGCVAGEKRVLSSNNTAGEGESIYWKYESWIKKLNSDFNTCIGAVGELIAFRKSLFEPLPEDTILDDFVISIEIAHRGYKVVYEPNAFAEEASSENEAEELKRKIRIAAGAFQCIFRYFHWLNFFRHPFLSFQYFSHKISRWIIVPFSLPIILVLNIYLFFQYPEKVIFQYLLFIQLVFYFIIIIQHFANLSSKIFRIPYYVLMMNIAMYFGFYKYLKGQQLSVWEKVKRKKV